MTFPVIMPVRGGGLFVLKAIRSAFQQTVPTMIHVINNGNENPELTEKLLALEVEHPTRVFVEQNHEPACVARSWNQGLCRVFGKGSPWALVINSDVQLHPRAYEVLLSTSRDFITGVGVSPLEGVDAGEFERTFVEDHPPDLSREFRPHPDFSCFLIRREVFLRVGLFDETFRPAYMEDWDYHRRMDLAGVVAGAVDVPFLHWACGTSKVNEQVQRDLGYRRVTNEYYRRKWGAHNPGEFLAVPFGRS